ncbi:hypothetical protein ACFQY0_17905 [Haloferula chungangensis]|uniref:Uncharacterized protein n=1 Tax=Haloferula chungangensis TaxID=1048331 RepID=A0ABW2LCL2_9BACT
MKTLLFLLFTLTVLHAEDHWPAKPYAHVVAYCYDFTKDPRGTSIIFKDGTHHAGIIAPFTLLLDAKQRSKLDTLLNTPFKGVPGDVDCYDPHHAFVFYDAKWKPIAWIDICFLCDNFSAVPNLPNAPIDLPRLERFVRELSLPFFESEAAYQELFSQHHTLTPKAPRPASDEVDPFAPPVSQ